MIWFLLIAIPLAVVIGLTIDYFDVRRNCVCKKDQYCVYRHSRWY